MCDSRSRARLASARIFSRTSGGSVAQLASTPLPRRRIRHSSSLGYLKTRFSAWRTLICDLFLPLLAGGVARVARGFAFDFQGRLARGGFGLLGGAGDGGLLLGFDAGDFGGGALLGEALGIGEPGGPARRLAPLARRRARGARKAARAGRPGAQALSGAPFPAAPAWPRPRP